MRQHDDELDHRGLIRDSYRIEGIGAPECRMIFLDWALSAPQGDAVLPQIRALLQRHAAAAPDHPMTLILQEAGHIGGRSAARGRRGGRQARLARQTTSS